MGILKSLNQQQKEAVGLLQIGTFLEYFDLMLYVHMAVLLNELFFPKTDPHTASLIAALAFCSTFVLRPFGALVFGYIGDHLGRKTTVIITTMMMSVSCVIMANLPTYAEIGILAAWIVTICRITQGLSSMGEIMGAEVYITEITKPPAQYPAVSFISVSSALGSVSALGIATLVTTTPSFNWRIAFWIGAGIALVGSIARTRLRETPDFIENSNALKQRKLRLAQEKQIDPSLSHNISLEKVQIKNVWALSLIYGGWPFCFYLVYMYFNPILKTKFGYTTEDIISHNFVLALVQFAGTLFVSILSYKVHPLKILKFIGLIFLLIVFFLPFLIFYATSSYHIFAIQVAVLCFPLGAAPANPIFIKSFPVLKRVTSANLTYATTRAIIYPITSFGLVYLTEFFGSFGLWIILLPITLSYLWAVNYYGLLENVRLPKITSLFRNNGQIISSPGVFQQEDYSNEINKTA